MQDAFPSALGLDVSHPDSDAELQRPCRVSRPRNLNHHVEKRKGINFLRIPRSRKPSGKVEGDGPSCPLSLQIVRFREVLGQADGATPGGEEPQEGNGAHLQALGLESFNL